MGGGALSQLGPKFDALSRFNLVPIQILSHLAPSPSPVLIWTLIYRHLPRVQCGPDPGLDPDCHPS